MPMEWSLIRFGAQTKKIWPIEATWASGTTAAPKANGFGQSSETKLCLGSPLEQQHRGPANDPREYYRRGVVSLPTPKCPGVT